MGSQKSGTVERLQFKAPQSSVGYPRLSGLSQSPVSAACIKWENGVGEVMNLLRAPQSPFHHTDCRTLARWPANHCRSHSALGVACPYSLSDERPPEAVLPHMSLWKVPGLTSVTFLLCRLSAVHQFGITGYGERRRESWNRQRAIMLGAFRVAGTSAFHPSRVTTENT